MSRERLSPEDARILALESDTVRGHTCKLLVIAGEHSTERLRAQLAPRLDAVPQLRRRLEARSRAPAWVDDPGFSLDRHVIDRGPANEPGFRRLVEELMTEPLDRERPLWAIDVVSPLAEGRTALVWRIHHALADGMTAIQMARALFLEAAPDDGPHPASRRARPSRPTRPLPRTAGAKLKAAPEMTAVLRRELSRRGAPSPLDRPAGPRREVAFVDAPLEQLRSIAHAAPERATVNDVVLTAVAGGLRVWLQELGAPEEGLRVKVPVSLHHLVEHATANRDSFMVIDLPLEEPDPVERLVAVTRETRKRKARRDAEMLDAFFRDVSRFSRSLERLAQRWAMSPRVFALSVSNVPGPAGPQLVLGSPLLEFHSIAEIAHRHALRVAVLSAGGRISFGLCSDPDAVDGLDVIADGIAAEIGALGAARAGGPPASGAPPAGGGAPVPPRRAG